MGRLIAINIIKVLLYNLTHVDFLLEPKINGSTFAIQIAK
jgi:hypothetical protein